MPQAVAVEAGVQVAWVEQGLQVSLLKIALDLLSPAAQQRAHQWSHTAPGVRQRPVRHPLQSREPGPAQQVHQHRLDLVIRSMPDQHSLGVTLFRSLEQEFVARLPRSFLDRHALRARVPANIHPSRDQFKAHRTSHLLHCQEVGSRFVPQRMIEMGNQDRIAASIQDIQQAQAVRSTRHTNHHQPVVHQMTLINQGCAHIIEHH